MVLHLDSQFYSVGLCVYLMPELHHLDHGSFVVNFEIGKCESFFFKVVLAMLGSLNFHMNFRISLSMSAKSQGLDRGCVESINQFGVSSSSHP